MVFTAVLIVDSCRHTGISLDGKISAMQTSVDAIIANDSKIANLEAQTIAQTKMLENLQVQVTGEMNRQLPELKSRIEGVSQELDGKFGLLQEELSTTASSSAAAASNSLVIIEMLKALSMQRPDSTSMSIVVGYILPALRLEYTRTEENHLSKAIYERSCDSRLSSRETSARYCRHVPQ